MRQLTPWRRLLDEMFIKIRGETHYLWRPADHAGKVLEVYVTKSRDKSAVLNFLRKATTRYLPVRLPYAGAESGETLQGELF